MAESMMESLRKMKVLLDERRMIRVQEQADYCKRTGSPHFAPSTGLCWSCGKDITDDSWKNTLITGCKFCNRSFCD